HCHIFIKGCSKEDYDDFFRVTGYIENTQETGAVTSVLPVCDSDECCKHPMMLTSPFRICKAFYVVFYSGHTSYAFLVQSLSLFIHQLYLATEIPLPSMSPASGG
ncbi:MAG: hypothetical protein MRZ30_06840, partial [Oscillospiraceae bacterium]|nr:hypothetical protein [Oscillospiraceae bacterium]